MTANTPSAPGWALTRLIQLHDGMRNDLALLDRIGAAVAAGDDAVAAADLDQLAIRRPGWTLPTFCAAFCGFVREHHTTEDEVVFPMLLHHADGRTGDLAAVVGKLKADHRVLAAYLDEANRAVGALPGDPPARAAAVRAIHDLAAHLGAHLDFEEERLAPALNAVSRIVSEDEVPAPPPGYADGVSGLWA
jgi:hypothetical protein